MLKLLDTANIKLAGVATDVVGVSGLAMLKAVIEGEASTQEMAALAKGSLRRRYDSVLALEGGLEEHHRFLLRCSYAGSKQLRRTSNIPICALPSG